ncbi:transposable element Tcb2 transposase [Trichonephila clavipes]|nr:transposable element Tcb2 transposase [Trichonephila clavipes]
MDRISLSEALAKRNEFHPFLKRMVAGDERWVTKDDIVRKRSWSKSGEAGQTGAKPELKARKDEVEKLAYQLNEEAERTERPIRRLSRIIGKLEEGRRVTSVAAEFGIAHSIVSRRWRQFQTTGRAIRGFSNGRPRGTTPTEDRYIVLQARRNRQQTAGEIARHTTQATGRPISRFTVARRLHGGGLFARRPVRCVPLTPAHRRRLLCGAGNAGIGETMNGDDEYSLQMRADSV